MPRITYKYCKDDLTHSWLKVEYSAPYFLYGSNVVEMKEAHIDRLFKRIRRYIADRLGVPLSQIPPARTWEVEKLHLCKNFHVGDNVQQYLRHLDTLDKTGGYKKHHVIGRNGSGLESVYFEKGKRQSRSVHKFYDKKAEILEQYDLPDKSKRLKEAEGILRYEIELSYSEMKKKSNLRLFGELLDLQFIVEMLNDGLKDLGLTTQIKVASFYHMKNILNKQPISMRQKSMLIALLSDLHDDGENFCKKKYNRQTYYKNYKELKNIFNVDKITFPEVNLPALKISRTDFRDKKKDCPIKK